MSVRRFDPNCPFCASTIAVAEFAQTRHFRAIYNVAPILPGHSLIIPKAHYQSIVDLDQNEISEFAVFAQRVTRFLQGAFAACGLNWTIQDGEAAGQTVPHLHLHIIPRSTGDLPHPGDWYPLIKASESRHIDDESRPRITEDDMRRIVEHLKGRWANEELPSL